MIIYDIFMEVSFFLTITITFYFAILYVRIDEIPLAQITAHFAIKIKLKNH